ncbi:MAG: prolipoprotein diacylglyceryl transferase [Deltaproteobacteria bacterium]|nr:prolipoprotein diacylglyceryl transferase [Deltaproteobacteria bacterium]
MHDLVLRQGCCYGIRTEALGLVFPVGSSVHADQFLAGLVRVDQPSLPVLPAQLASAAACFLLARRSWTALRERRSDVFFTTVGAYSGFRFAIEFVRADAARNQFAVLSTSQWVALVVLSALAGKRVWNRSQVDCEWQ